MDILSLSRAESNRPELQPKPTSRKPVEATDKAPPGSAIEKQNPQKEASRSGQKSPENLLDLLENKLTSKLELSADVKLALSKVQLPPQADALIAAMSALGVPVQSLPQAAATLGAPVLDALQATDLPQPVKAALGDLLKTSMVGPMPAASLIGMGRENTPTPPTQAPMAFSSAGVEPAPAPTPAIVPTPSSVTDEPRFESGSDKVAEGQTFDGDVIDALNPTAVSNSGEPIRSSVRIVPNPTLGEIPHPAFEVPRPTLGDDPEITIVPRPVADLDPEQPVPAALGKPENGDEVVSVPRPGVGPVPTTVPNPGVGPQPTTVSRFGQGQEPKPAEQLPVAGTVNPGTNLQERSLKASNVKPEATAEIEGKQGEIAPMPREGRPVPTLEQGDPLALLDDADDAPSASSTKSAPEPAPVVERPIAASVTAPKPEVKADPLPKPTAEKVVDQLSSRIETMAMGRKPSKVTVRLEPRDLGTITLHVKALGQKVDASVQASHDDVRASLEANRQLLVQNVEGRGLTLNSFDIKQDSGQHNGQAQQASQDEAARNANLRAATGQKPAPASSQRPVYRSSTSAVDYTV